jgi:hypothetical protein
MPKRGWTIVELLVVVACLGLLAGLVAPSLSAVRDAGRRIRCVSQLHSIHAAMMTYAAASHLCMPPFRFCDVPGNLPASGHWGGPSQAYPMTVGNPMAANLWCLVAEGMLVADVLRCPSSAAELRSSQDSMFPYTSQFGTYCLRFPPSRDLFAESPRLADYHGEGLLGVYLMYAGGQRALATAPGHAGATYQTVPLVRLTCHYRLDPAVAPPGGLFDPATDAIISDEFWWQGYAAQAPTPPKGIVAYAAQAAWCHGRWFNVLYGGGAVQTVADDGTIAANSIPPGGSLVDSWMYFGKYAERVWQHFDAAR